MNHFVWDPRREWVNIHKHGVDFAIASKVFQDPQRKIFEDFRHGEKEKRFYCIGKVSGRILTVRFVYRENTIRIFGAGYWRKGRTIYGKEES